MQYWNHWYPCASRVRSRVCGREGVCGGVKPRWRVWHRESGGGAKWRATGSKRRITRNAAAPVHPHRVIKGHNAITPHM
eukprot:5714884-Prymnesium_polylepis.1